MCVYTHTRRESPNTLCAVKSLSPLYTLDSTLTVVRRFPTSIKTTKLNNFLPFVLMMYTSEQTPHPSLQRDALLSKLPTYCRREKKQNKKNKIEKLRSASSSAAVTRCDPPGPNPIHVPGINDRDFVSYIYMYTAEVVLCVRVYFPCCVMLRLLYRSRW